MAGLFIGLMSGTSLDALDGVILDVGALRVVAHAQAPLPASLRATFDALNRPGADELHRAAMAARDLAELGAGLVAALLRDADVPASRICAIGSHGQTVRHRPELGYTLQIDAPALLAERCGMTVVADFRSRDVAAGGQGAPLVPAFHRACFGRAGHALAVLNLGGIANLSLQGGHGDVMGFDCGPANTLLDAWAQRHLGQPFDADGAWASGGTVDTALLRTLLRDPYFAAPPPKSTGRDHFNIDWLDRARTAHPEVTPRDVQATLAELSARAIAADLQHHQPEGRELLVCGGGIRNRDFMARLGRLLPAWRLIDTTARGIPPQQVEAAAFAWLAHRALAGLPGNLPQATGATGPRVLGAIWPAGEAGALASQAWVAATPPRGAGRRD